MQTSKPRTDRSEERRPARGQAGARRETSGNGAAVPPPLTATALQAAQRAAGNAAVTGMIARRALPAPAPEQHDTGVDEVLDSAGKPFTGPVRQEMESRFQTDFSGVRLHTGPAAARSARAIGARAYTSGSHVVLGDGGGDKHTLAHELTHVIQQRQGPVSGTDHGNGLRISDPGDRFEREAEATAAQVLRGPASLRRQSADQEAEAPGTAWAPSVQRMRAESEQELPVALIQPGYASGDQFGIAAMLIHDPTRHVYLTCDPGERKPAERIESFYRESGIEQGRIHVVEVDPSANSKKAVEAQYRKDFAHLGADGSSGSALGKKFIAVGDATKYVGDNFSEDMRKEVRAGWGLEQEGTTGHPKDPQVEAWLKGKGVRAEGKTIAVLWSRFSGKKGEVHIEHDSSYIGMAQMIAGLGGLDLVLIVGDAAPKSQQNTKYKSIAAGYGNEDQAEPGHDVRVPEFNAKVVDLTEFWKDSEIKEWGGETRTGQFLVFDYLNRSGTVRHLGFRSGNLEAMALMGFTVRYMEEPDSVIGGSRMEAWHAADGTAKTKGGGMAPGYERLRVSAPPTRSGKYQKSLTLDEQKGDQKHADWHRTEKDSYSSLKKTDQDPRSGSLRKGFTDEDLANIDAYLLTGNSEEGLAPDLIDAVKELARQFTDAEERLFKAGSEAKKARDASDKMAADSRKKESVKNSARQKAERLTQEEEETRASSEPIMEAAANRFQELCVQYGLVQGLRARNLYAANIAHRLPPDAPA